MASVEDFTISCCVSSRNEISESVVLSVLNNIARSLFEVTRDTELDSLSKL